MAQLKFYKTAQAPANAAAGAIWFDTTNHTIQVKTDTGWDKYAGALNDATWDGLNLTITKHDGSSIVLNFSDLASASGVTAALAGKLDVGTNADVAGTQSYYGLKADIAAAQAADKILWEAADASLKTELQGYTDSAVAAKNVEAEPANGELVTATAANNKVTVGVTDKLTNAVAKAEAAASADDLSGVAARVTAIETVLGDVEDPDNNVIDRISEVIAYFNGVAETETGAALLETVAGHTTDISDLQNNTVNGKKISENPVLDGADILITGYETQTAGALAATDSINVALGKLEARVDAAAAGGVQSVGGKAGSITLDTDAEGEGNVKFAISEAGEISATVNIGATAAQGALADSAVQTVVSGSANGTIAVDGTEVAVHGLGSAAYTDAAAYDAAGTAAGLIAELDAELDAEVAGIFKVIEDNEKVAASALNDLDARLQDVENKKGSIESALQASDITTGSANGTISVKGSDIQVKGLGSAAYTEASDYATAAQGAKADTAYQKPEAGIPLTDLASRVYTQEEVDAMWAWVEF